jgi:cell pole-organizing protein PopZ
MSESKNQSEPSMEEILASIRRIIADDGETAAPAAAGPQPAEAPPPPPPPPPPPAPEPKREDVLELTQVVDDDGLVVDLDAENDMPPPEPEPMFEPEPEPMFPPPPPPRPTPSAPMRGAMDDMDDRLVSAATAAASTAALSEFVSFTNPRGHEMPLGNVNRTLEDIVRELLRPMLREWLDANLPDLVERLVREEIDRMARQAQTSSR